MYLDYHPFNGKLPGEKEAELINAKVKWRWNASPFMPEYNQIMITPVVAQLNDDNNDGVINGLDVADIVVTTYAGKAYTTPSIVRALSGIDGDELWAYETTLLADPRFSPAVADLDGDGIVEVLVVDGRAGLLRIANHKGEQQKLITLVDKSISNINIADINNDGIAEILVGKTVVSANGDRLFSHSWSADSIAFDSNNDGQQEVLAAGSLFDKNGQLLWAFSGADTPWFASIANFDADLDPEIVVSTPGTFATEHTIAMLEHNGNVKWIKENIKSHGGGAQAVSNFLGKSKLGIVYAGYTSVDMLDANGELVWQVAMDDAGSGKIGLSAFDFNADGRDEVSIQDHFKVAILDGLTGKEVFVVANSTGSLWEYPIVVDLEGDDNAEMIVVANDQIYNYKINHGVTVYESADLSVPWKNATRIWNQHSFHVTNIDQNGQVPLREKNSWLDNNSYRSATLK
ncbi:FG-GAP repeat domain-containing protein [Psychromonas sp. Urea-02u-13]|uniref:FG-GAP repeat domain-containing protein n=1 Tax=Psychromonas sp. Urea-02u-13 TaxID=2058326 RepID=UPI002FCDAB5D